MNDEKLNKKVKNQMEDLKKSAAIAGLVFFAIVSIVYLIFR